MDAMKADIPRQRTVSSELNRIQLDEAIREREKKREWVNEEEEEGELE